MKQLSLIILVTILMLLLVSCNSTSTVTTDSKTETTAAPVEALGVPLSADYEGYEFHVLTSGCGGNCNDFMYEEESALPLDNAQYKRKLRVEEDYNIKIIETEMNAGSSTGSGKGFMEISTAVNAGDCVYDLALIAGYDVSTLAYNGFLYDLNSVPGIDLSKSWWDKNANESLTVNGTIFFTAGDITVADNNTAFVIMFNKKLQSDYDLESPYDLVYDGEWTFEKFGTLCKTVTEDLNQDNVMNDSDRFGLLVWDDSVVGFVNAAGERCCTINEDGEIELTIYNENTLSALDKFFGIAFDTDYALMYQRYGSGTAFEQKLWSGDQGLFWTTYMRMVPSFREMESDFGLLPYPKLNEQQTEYYTTMAPYFSQFICVPLIQNDENRTGVITEALAYYGQQIVNPAYYDVNLIGQNTRDEESADMLDIVFDNLVYDIGYYYQIGPFNKHLIYMVRENDSNFTSRYETYRPVAETMLKTINNYYAEAVSIWEK